MKQTISRREFMSGVAAVGAISKGLLGNASGTSPGAELDFSLVDFHAHIEGDMTLERALQLAKERGVKPGIAEHGGCREHMKSDEDIKRYIASLAGHPVYKGMQAEGHDWMRCFSKEVVAQLDFVLADALTFPERDGRWVRLWTPEVKLSDEQDFTERYVDSNVRVISNEPIDVFANPTFLPEALAEEYDVLWTEERMEKVIAAAVKYGVAIEINSRYKIPSATFLRLAKGAGVRFSFGSNAHGDDVGRLHYSIRMARRLGLTRDGMFIPAPIGEKPIMRRSCVV